MFSKSRSLLLAAALMATPLATALAQQNNPAGNMGSNNSVTASSGTADSKAASGMHTGDVGSHAAVNGNYGGSAMNGTTPGATGRTVVPGSNSSPSSVAAATSEQKTGAQTSGGK